MTALLEVQGLSKVFPAGGGRLHAVEDVSFALDRGEVVAVVGESGSGKSTTARLIARLLEPTEGTILLDGVDQLRQERRPSLAYRRRVQIVFQDPFGSLNPLHTVHHHLARPLLIHGRARRGDDVRGQVRKLLTAVGLEPADEIAGRRPHQLSGGQRQRVALARALAVEPDVILADEPVSMLDVSIRTGVLNLIRRLSDDHGVAFLYITHDLASARYVGDRILVMYGGRMVEGGGAEDVLRTPRHPYTRLLLDAVPEVGGDEPSVPSVARAEPPSLIDPGPGCPFAERCPHVLSRCRETMPAITEVASERWVRCYLHQP